MSDNRVFQGAGGVASFPIRCVGVMSRNPETIEAGSDYAGKVWDRTSILLDLQRRNLPVGLMLQHAELEHGPIGIVKADDTTGELYIAQLRAGGNDSGWREM